MRLPNEMELHEIVQEIFKAGSNADLLRAIEMHQELQRRREVSINESLDELQESINAWQERTFPGGTAEGQFNHLVDEVMEELSKDLTNGEEIADCMILLMGIASKAGVNVRRSIQQKMEKNRKRKWGEMDERGVVKHITTTEGEG